MGDYMVRATAANAQVRAFAVTTKELVETARQAHNTSPVVTAALGRLLTAGVMMGSMLKGDDDLLTLQVRGDGPVRGLTVTANAKGEVKGYAMVPDVILPANAKGKLDVGGAVGRGTLSVIRDLGLKEPYVGQTALVTGEIGDDLTSYFATSEQTPSSVGLGVLMGKTNTVRCAGGFIIQLMPFAEEETISKLEHNLSLINSVTALLDQGMTPEQLLERVLDGFDVEITDRLPKQLSGGQKQRVALARAIVRKPKAFLMDEPLSNLDAKLRNSTRIEIVRLQQRLGVTTIYVTHDQTEAMTMADRIVVMKEGVIQQVGTPQEIYAAPVNLFVASFIGTPQMNFIPGKLSETGFENESFRLSLPDALKAKLRSSIGKEVILGLRPEALAVSEGIQENTIPVRLEEVEYMGRKLRIRRNMPDSEWSSVL